MSETQEEMEERIPKITKMGKFTAFKSSIDDNIIHLKLEGFEFDCKRQPARIAVALYCAILINVIEKFGDKLINMSDEQFQNSVIPELNTYNNVGTKTFPIQDNLPDDLPDDYEVN